MYDSDMVIQQKIEDMIRPISHGIDWVGYRVFRTHIRMRKSTAIRMKRRVKYLARQYGKGRVDGDAVFRTLRPDEAW